MSQPSCVLDTRVASPPPPAFRSALSFGRPRSAWMHVAGELHVAAAPELALSLRDVTIRARLLVLDLRDLTFIDSSGAH